MRRCFADASHEAAQAQQTPTDKLVAVTIPRDRPPVLVLARKGVAETAGGKKDSTLRLWRDPRVGPYLMFGALSCCAQAINVYTLGFVIMDSLSLLAGQAQTYIGVAMSAGAVAGLVGQWVLIPWLKMSPRQLLRAGGVLTIGFAFCRPGFTAGASLAAREDQQGGVENGSSRGSNPRYPPRNSSPLTPRSTISSTSSDQPTHPSPLPRRGRCSMGGGHCVSRAGWGFLSLSLLT